MKKISLLYYMVIVAMVFSSCSGGKYAATEKVYRQKAQHFGQVLALQPSESQLEKIDYEDKEWIGSVNFGIRKPNYVMIHHTAQNSLEQTVRTFHSERAQVSSHYVIGRDGKIVQMVNDYLRAHHAGSGMWGNDTDLNSSSIGIELDNDGLTDPWPDAQIDALIQLLNYLKKAYNIPQANFIGHMDYAPSRKIDPSRFPWEKLAEAGFGFWYDDELEPAPEDLDIKVALRVIGFDIKNLPAAIKGFKYHYIQKDADVATLNDHEMAILYTIYLKYLYL